LSTFVLRNQATTKGKKDKSNKKSRREKNKEKDATENGDNQGSPGDSNSENADGENGDVEIDAGSDDELTRRINAEAKGIDHNSDVDDHEWAVDVSEEAVKARAMELPNDLKRTLVLEDADEDGEGENGGSNAYDQLGSWIINSAEQNADGISGVSDVDIYLKAKELGIENKHKTLTVLAQTIFDDKIARQIPKRAGMLKKVLLPRLLITGAIYIIVS
jgi:translation initiation factor 5